MRRLSAFLMIAVLVAVLVPSSALAGKPPSPNIMQIEVYGDGGTIGSCSVTVKATFEGRAYAAQFRQWLNGGLTTPPAPTTIVRKSSTVEQGFTGLNFVNWHHWSVVLVDRKGNPLSLERWTGMDSWGGNLPCPTSSNLIAFWYPPIP